MEKSYRDREIKALIPKSKVENYRFLKRKCKIIKEDNISELTKKAKTTS